MNKKLISVLIVLTTMLFILPLVSADTQYTFYHNKSLATSQSVTAQWGFQIVTNFSGQATLNVTRASGVTGTVANFYNSTTFLGNTTNLSGNTFIFNTLNFTDATNTYYITIASAGASYTRYYQSFSTFPVNVANTTVGMNITGNCGNNNAPTLPSCGFGEFNNVQFYSIGVVVASITNNVTITVKDFYTNTSLTNFTAIAINASGYQYNGTTTSGTLDNWTYSFLQNSTSLWNITLTSTENGGYFNKTLLNQNVSSNIATTMAQSSVGFIAYEKVTGNLITTANFTTSYLTNTTHYMRVQNYNVTASASGYYNRTIPYTPTALTSASVGLAGMYTTIYNVTARNNVTGTPISDFSYYIKSLDYNWNESGTASGIMTNISLIQGNYEIRITATGFAPTIENITISANGAVNQTFNMFAENSIYFQIFNVSSLALITNQTITVQAYSSSYYINTTTNGTLFMSGFEPDVYNITVTTTGYEIGSNVVTIGNNSFQYLNVYLESDTSNSVIFTVYDDETSVILQNTLVSIEKQINGTYYLINAIYTDISGRIEMPYEAGQRYRFSFSKSGYAMKTFELNPILFSSYDIRMQKSVSDPLLTAFAGMSLRISPSAYYNNMLNNVSITMADPEGRLQLFNYTVVLSVDNSTYSNTSINAFGDTLTSVINITNATASDKVYLYYSYTTTDGQIYSFTNIYDIKGTADNGSFAGLSNNQFNLALLDRVIILTLILLIAGGLATMIGGFAAGGFISIATLSYFGAVGFVSWWFVTPVGIALFILIAWSVR